MPAQPIVIKSTHFTPAAVGSTETTPIFSVKRGHRILWASLVPEVNAAAGTTSTVTIGDTGDTDGFVTTSDLDLETATVGTPISGTGAFLATSGGKLYTTADTIDVVYTANGATGAKPRLEIKVAYITEWPT